MANSLRRLGISVACLLVVTSSAAQQVTPQKMERELVKLGAKVSSFYYSDFDTLALYSNLFTDKIIHYVSKYPSTLRYPFRSLQDSIGSVATSDDGLFRIYSWDTWLGGTMHFFRNIYQYEAGGKVRSNAPEPEEGDPAGFYSDIFTLNASGKRYYLAINNAMYSTKDVRQSIKVFAIGNKTLIDTIKLFKTKTTLLNQIDVDFDFFSVVDRPERPVRLIKYDPKEKVVVIPIVLEDGKVTDRFIVYKFNGQYFEHVETQRRSKR